MTWATRRQRSGPRVAGRVVQRHRHVVDAGLARSLQAVGVDVSPDRAAHVEIRRMRRGRHAAASRRRFSALNSSARVRMTSLQPLRSPTGTGLKAVRDHPAATRRSASRHRSALRSAAAAGVAVEGTAGRTTARSSGIEPMAVANQAMAPAAIGIASQRVSQACSQFSSCRTGVNASACNPSNPTAVGLLTVCANTVELATYASSPP